MYSYENVEQTVSAEHEGRDNFQRKQVADA